MAGSARPEALETWHSICLGRAARPWFSARAGGRRLFRRVDLEGAGIASYALGLLSIGGFRAARVLGFAQVRSLVHQARWDWRSG